MIKPVGFLSGEDSKASSQNLKVDANGKRIMPWSEFDTGKLTHNRGVDSLAGMGLYKQAVLHQQTVYHWRVNEYRTIEELHILIEWLEEHNFKLMVLSTYERTSKPDPLLYFASPQALLEVSTEPPGKAIPQTQLYMALITTDKALYDSFMSRIPCLLKRVPTQGSLKMLVQVAPDKPVTIRDAGAVNARLDRANYMPDVVEGFEYVVEEMKKKRPRGRITVLNGPPGTGKTFLMRALVSEVSSAMFVVVPPSKVSEVGNPEFVNALIEGRTHANSSIILLLEDADEVLSKRSTANVSSISNVLNLGDGLYGEAMDIRIVATTNVEKEHLDPAVMRPGRLCRHLEVGALDAAQARITFKKLLPEADESEVFPEGATLAEVYALAQDRGYDPDKKTATKTEEETPLNDEQKAALSAVRERAEVLGFPSWWIKKPPEPKVDDPTPPGEAQVPSQEDNLVSSLERLAQRLSKETGMSYAVRGNDIFCTGRSK